MRSTAGRSGDISDGNFDILKCRYVHFCAHFVRTSFLLTYTVHESSGLQHSSSHPTSPRQRCSASPEKSPDLRLVFLPGRTVDRAGHRLILHPEILPLRGRFFAPVRIPAAKVSRIRTFSEGSCFYKGARLLTPVSLQVPAGRDGPQGLFFLESFQ